MMEDGYTDGGMLEERLGEKGMYGLLKKIGRTLKRDGLEYEVY